MSFRLLEGFLTHGHAYIHASARVSTVWPCQTPCAREEMKEGASPFATLSATTWSDPIVPSLFPNLATVKAMPGDEW